MRIAQVSARFSPFVGGLEVYCHELSKHLANRGHEVKVITSRLDRGKPLEEETDGFEIHRCPCLTDFLHLNPITFIVHELMRIKPDIIHAHSYIFLTSNQAALAKKLSGTPFLLHLHGIDCAHPSNDLSTLLRFQVKKKLYDPTLGKWTAQAADAVACVSKRDMELAKKLWGLDGSKVHWVPNAVNLEEFNGRDSDGPSNVLFVGRLEAWKGIETFLQAAKLIRKERDDVCFSVVGDGSLRSYVEREAPSINAKVLGQVHHTMIPEIISQASVLVLPSYMEGLPTVCLEALAAGVPVVASNVGGTPEVVIDGETGYLFPAGESYLCAEKVLRLLTDERLRNRMGRRGLRLVEKFYTWEKVVEKVERIYQKIRGK